MPWLEWIVNVMMCLAFWGVLSLVSRYVHSRKLWNDLMSVACFLWVLGLRFRHPAAYWVPFAIFAWGVFAATDESRYNVPARVAFALVGAVLWFQFGMWNLVASMFYFCSGCFSFFG